MPKTTQPCYTYLWSFAFKNYSTAQNVFLFHNWIAGLILPIATTIMSFFEGTVAVSAIDRRGRAEPPALSPPAGDARVLGCRVFS